jgi:hypothetical protein
VNKHEISLFGRINYYPGFKTEFAQPADFVQGTTCQKDGGGSLTAIQFDGILADYSAEPADLQKDSWFPDIPCAVSITGSGCYLAWSNDTHYFEEGNYILENLNYVEGCPNCTKTLGEATDGQCVNDGTPRCSPNYATYRCVATRVLECDQSLLVGTWSGSCRSRTGTDPVTENATCADGECEQPYR